MFGIRARAQTQQWQGFLSWSEDICLIAEVGGPLTVKFMRGVVSHEDVSRILKAMTAPGLVLECRGVNFDFSSVHTLEPHWTLVLALILDFARRTILRCQIAGLCGQPAAAAALYQCNRELQSLLASSGKAA